MAGRRVTVLSQEPGCAKGCGFEVGRAYLVYAHSYKDELVAGNCSRTRPLEAAGPDLAELGQPPDVFPVTPAGGFPWPLAAAFGFGIATGVVAALGVRSRIARARA